MGGDQTQRTKRVPPHGIHNQNKKDFLGGQKKESNDGDLLYDLYAEMGYSSS